jgi:hypothetical protein
MQIGIIERKKYFSDGYKNEDLLLGFCGNKKNFSRLEKFYMTIRVSIFILWI